MPENKVDTARVENQAEPIDVRDCPECDDGTKGDYDGRVLIGGRGIYRCGCGTKWQDANEKPSEKGIPVKRRPATPEQSNG